MQVDFNQYIMDPTNEIVEMRKGGMFNRAIILTYKDGSEWVFLNNKGEERFCGFLYLQNAINELNLKCIRAAENKIAIHEKKIIYLSKYYGDKNPDTMDFENNDNLSDELLALKRDIGFADTAGNANLRKQDNVVYVFDTEKSSFAKSVHEKIDSFAQQHKALRSTLEESLNEPQNFRA